MRKTGGLSNEADHFLSEGEDVRVSAAAKDLYFFDKQTGDRLRHENPRHFGQIVVGGWA